MNQFKVNLHITFDTLFSYLVSLGFLGSLASKESACSAGTSSSIPRLGRSAGEQILHYSILGLPWWLRW